MQTADDASSTAAPSQTDHEQQSNDDQEQQCNPSALLFSLQFFLSSVDLPLPQTTATSKSQGSSVSGGADFLVGFQLTQYEIVLFDAVPATPGGHGDGVDANAGTEDSNGGSERILLKHQHGKSCLFEADAEHLALDLQRECDAPLALLVMQQDHGKARLVAFASVPIELHVGLLNRNSSKGGDGARNTSSVNQEMRFRVCEWASSSGKWELRDHCNRVVGVATGAVTLSCLGRSLAPHIVNAIGLHVDKAVLPLVQERRDSIKSHRSSLSVRDSSSSLDLDHSSGVNDSKRTSKRKSRAALNGGKSGGAEAVSADRVSEGKTPRSEPVPAQKADMAVQCDQELIFGCEEDSAAERSHAVPRGNHCQVRPAVYIEPRKKLEHACSSEKHLRLSPVKSRSRCMRRPDYDSSFHNGQRNNYSIRHIQHAKPASSLFARDLPPPLFFQKPKQQQQQKR